MEGSKRIRDIIIEQVEEETRLETERTRQLATADFKHLKVLKRPLKGRNASGACRTHD